MKVFPGAKIHIFTVENKTMMTIKNNHGRNRGFLDVLDSFEESITVLSDPTKGRGCDLCIEVLSTKSHARFS
jgi:hypothetical protein